MALREDISERAHARVGQVLNGKYTLDRVVGIGGMATVYAATHRNKRRYAVKMLHTDVAMDGEVTLRFIREGYVANTVGHPGTVQVFDDDVTEDGAPFLVMELLEGETLEARWERKLQALPASEVLAVVDQLLDVLAAAHDQGIVHRDLKPENLFLTTEGELKVLDFGIARLRELGQGSDATTRAGSLLGTPAFMSPEQARGRWNEVDGRTDLWALGATVFALLTGRFVHRAETVNEQLIAAATEPAESIARVLPELNPTIIELVDRALAFRKDDRWPDARAMQLATRTALQVLTGAEHVGLPKPSVVVNVDQATLTGPASMTQLVQSQTVSTAGAITSSVEPPAPSPRRRKGVVIGGAAVAAGVFIAVAAFSTSSEPPEDAPVGASVPTSPTAAPAAQPPSAAPAADTGPTVEPVAMPSPPPSDAGVAAKPQKPKPAPTPKFAEPTLRAPVKPTRPAARPVKPTKPASPEGNPFDQRH